MHTLVCNGTVITPSKVISGGGVLFHDGVIEAVGREKEIRARFAGGRGGKARLSLINAGNRIILPGFINAHHHLYSTFARGMAVPGAPAKNFIQILEKLWWKLDNELTTEDVYFSALVPLLECVRNGVTTIIDHHESQGLQIGVLDILRQAVERTGIRAALCLGTSDRYHKGWEGVVENARFLGQLRRKPSRLVSGMVGLHAAFTVSDETLAASVAVAEEYGAGLHVHCAEDLSDQRDSLAKHKLRVVARLKKFAALGEKTLLVHCVHIDEREMNLIRASGSRVVHNPESNMNNAVGCADVLRMMGKGITVGLGSDGMSSDMLAQMRCAYLLQRHDQRDPRIAFCEAPAMLLENNAAIAATIFARKLGKLEAGAPADITIMDYVPPTPLVRDNFLGHLLFGMVDAAVDTVICDGEVLLRDKKFITIDEERICARSRELAAKFWKRIASA
ncbi:MAG: putative aminohydrolase SsnA [Candidatus Aminicenantes bacterium]|nr:putative aminohydrolase SsnA [Candidatus Aminicenantes bacterium]